MKKWILIIMAVTMATIVNGAVDHRNYVWNTTEWVPWLSTADGKPKIDLNLVNLTADGIQLNGSSIWDWSAVNGSSGVADGNNYQNNLTLSNFIAGYIFTGAGIVWNGSQMLATASNGSGGGNSNATLWDMFMNITGGKFTGAITGTSGTFSATIQAEQLTSTDDATITDDLDVGGESAFGADGTVSAQKIIDIDASPTLVAADAYGIFNDVAFTETAEIYSNDAYGYYGNHVWTDVVNQVMNGQLAYAGYFKMDTSSAVAYNDGDTYGLYTEALSINSDASTAFGIYAKASGAATNYAGYFDGGDVYVANDILMTEDDFIGIGASTERIHFDGGSNEIEIMGAEVGIGTQAPDTLLHIESAGDAAITLRADVGNSGEDDNPYIHMIQDDATITATIGMVGNTDTDSLGAAETGTTQNAFYLAANANQDIQFGTAGSVKMTIDNSGEVGIGDTTPTFGLEVVGNASVVGAPLFIGDTETDDYSDTTLTTAGIAFSPTSAPDGIEFMSSTATNGYGGKLIGVDKPGTGGFVQIQTINNGAVADTIEIMHNGNVGIGADSFENAALAPATKLDIDSNSNTLALRIRGTAGTTEIADIYVRASGALVLSTARTGAASSYIEVDGEDNQYGLVIRDSNTGSAVFSNLYMTDAAVDYLTIQSGAATGTGGINVMTGGNVGFAVIPDTDFQVQIGSDALGVAAGAVTPTTANGAGDLYVQDNLEVDGSVTTTGGAGLTQGAWVFDGNANGGCQLTFTDGWLTASDCPTEGECFLAGTKITMADNSLKNIEDIKEGEKVLGYNKITDELTNAEVIETHIVNVSEYYIIEFDDNSQIKVTSQHPIFTEEVGWGSIIPDTTTSVHTEPLEVGYNVKTSKGWKQIIGWMKVEEDVTVYNLNKVSGARTFFAGDSLVHNKCYQKDSIIDGIKVQNIKVGDIINGKEVIITYAKTMLNPIAGKIISDEITVTHNHIINGVVASETDYPDTIIYGTVYDYEVEE